MDLYRLGLTIKIEATGNKLGGFFTGGCSGASFIAINLSFGIPHSPPAIDFETL